MWYTIVILEEGKRPYPRYPQCEMFVPQKSLNGRHLVTEFFRQIMESKWIHLEEDESQAGTERALAAYLLPLFQVNYFK